MRSADDILYTANAIIILSHFTLSQNFVIFESHEVTSKITLGGAKGFWPFYAGADPGHNFSLFLLGHAMLIKKNMELGKCIAHAK